MAHTSIEWLNKKLEDYGDPQFCELEWKELDKLIEQAKSMHKAEVIDAWDNGCEDDGIIDNAEQYYNETFKK